MKNRKHNTEIDKKRTSAHTRRFRVIKEVDKFTGEVTLLPCAPIYQRTLTTVGGSRTRPSPYGRSKLGGKGKEGIPIAPITALPFSLAKAIESMAKTTSTMLGILLPKSRRELKRII